jgi:tetratricopeptide (TPR) repeat protein
VASLYSHEFYEIVRSRLKPSGFMTQWLPAYQVPADVTLAMVRAFIDAFPTSVLLSGQGAELILLGTPARQIAFDLDAVQERLRARPAVMADLERVRMGTLVELAGSFVADAEALRQATAGIAPVTDDRPSMEYAFGRAPEVPSSLFALSGLWGFCPKCFDGDAPSSRVAWLGDYEDALAALYASEAFRKNTRPMTVKLEGGGARALERSAYLRASFGPHDSPLTRAYALAQAGRLVEAARAYERALAASPDDAEARYNLAAVYASLGREEDAVAEAKRALGLRPGYAKAKAMLCALRHVECGL